MTDGNWTSRGDYFVIYKNIESLCCIPETDIKKYIFPIKGKNHKLLTVVSEKLQRVRTCAGNTCRVFILCSLYTSYIYIHYNMLLSNNEEAPRSHMK